MYSNPSYQWLQLHRLKTLFFSSSFYYLILTQNIFCNNFLHWIITWRYACTNLQSNSEGKLNPWLYTLIFLCNKNKTIFILSNHYFLFQFVIFWVVHIYFFGRVVQIFKGPQIAQYLINKGGLYSHLVLYTKISINYIESLIFFHVYMNIKVLKDKCEYVPSKSVNRTFQNEFCFHSSVSYI